MSEPYPLTFKPVVLEKVWGGRRLANYQKKLSKPEAKYGESWEVADLAETAAGGAGGQAVRSVIDNGPMKGKTIADAMAAWGDALVPALQRGKTGGFPLLIKLLDAAENLSVQVHPSLAYAAANPGCHVKTECWYVLDAEPGSVIYRGLKPGVTKEVFEAAVRGGGTGLPELLSSVPAVKGECHSLPSGTVHALGKGVLVAEVQTPSDTTFRIFDWGRNGRELHPDAAIACARIGGAPPPTRAKRGPGVSRLLSTEHFNIDECVNSPEEPGGPIPRGCVALISLAGRVQVVGSKIEKVFWVRPGGVGVVPAHREGGKEWRMFGAPGSRWLVVTLPERVSRVPRPVSSTPPLPGAR